MYSTYYDGMDDASSFVINTALSDFENKFAPVPPKDDLKWFRFFLDLVTIGIAGPTSVVFNSGRWKLLAMDERTLIIRQY